MNDNDFKAMWQSAHQSELVNIEKRPLLLDLSARMNKLDKTIKKRNFRELAIGIVLIIFFSFVAYIVPYTLTKIACLLIIPYFLFYIHKINSVRRFKTSDFSQPPKQFLISQKKYIKKEKELLDTVLYWAILPLLPILILFYAGFRMDLTSYIGFGLFTLVILIIVYALNKYASKKTFIPLLNKLDNLIREFDEKKANN